MDGPALSPRELLILQQIESELGSDQELERELRTMRPARLARLRRTLVARPWIVVAVISCCLAVSFGLLALAVVLNQPVLLLAVVIGWAVVLVMLTVVATHLRRRGRIR
ncbi:MULTISPECIES: hypothetical protein [Kitasatospora]|uniref:DUF3040 domain-containing protein n=1 Tax=Kitasatospora setae (strain ATCC 33774 / DSM 43861 / JCM 3304 / KCC A-0304 / NBRC 14216 / KM-6054) TaxID=452652 RepID=E4N4Z9_KITSK|nr:MULTISPECIES: hypothetical protein [Kitasatospora]BAJ26280.1 hypothetical protein KSE_04330 [Kitasatospora setae KM-6054]